MTKTRIKRLVSLLLALCVLLPLGAAPAWAVTQADIDALKEERDALAAQREEKQAVVEELEQRQAGVLEQKLAMDERNEYTLQQIGALDQEIALCGQMIEQKAAEVDQAKLKEEKQLDRYRTRVRAMEENGELGILALLFDASDLGELLTAIDDIGEIMQSDRELEDEYIAAREDTERAKAEYEESRRELESQQQLLKDEQTQLELDIEEAKQLIAQLEDDIENNRVQIDDLLKAEDAANARINGMVAQLSAQQAGGGGGGAGSAGGFVWPLPASTYCTSRFGLRVHPIYHTERNHTGLDIAAPSGSVINAAAGGTVTMADVNGGYGNCVMIDHGNGSVTLYGHMSSFAVSAGDSVSAGQTIGYVGESGLATGPHLHFEIIVGGGRVDPEQYFTGLSFSPDAGV